MYVVNREIYLYEHVVGKYLAVYDVSQDMWKQFTFVLH